jgi:hypothetical protein
MNMKMTIEEITPSKAIKYLETVDTSKQRPLKQSKIDDYAVSMARGHWVVTHQGIAFDDDGNLCDGQHRLHAVVKSGVTIRTQVTRNLTQKQNDLFTFDAIDQGVKRNVGEQMHVRYGVANANQTAAAAKKIVHLCIGKNPVMSVAMTVAVWRLYEKEIAACIQALRPTKTMLHAPILGSAAFCMRPGGENVMRFIEKVGSGEDLKSGDPALTFRQYALNRPVHGGGVRGAMEAAFCLCAMHAMVGNKLKTIKHTHRGVDFFADKQPRVVKAIADMFEI